MEGQPTKKLVVNSVGAILRHEKLCRLEKVLRLAVLQGQMPAKDGCFGNTRGPTRYGNVACLRTRADTKKVDGFYNQGVSEDQNTEVQMLMGATKMEFSFLQRSHASTAQDTLQLEEALSLAALTRRSRRHLNEPWTMAEFGEHGALHCVNSRRRTNETTAGFEMGEIVAAGKDMAGGDLELMVHQRPPDHHARTRNTPTMANVAVRSVGQIRQKGAPRVHRELNVVRAGFRELLGLAQARAAKVAERMMTRSARTCIAAQRKTMQLTAEILNDQGRFMKQDDFVLYASGGDTKNVRKGLAEKRLCSVKGSHKEKGHCAFFAAGLSLISVESELRNANRDRSRLAVPGVKETYRRVPGDDNQGEKLLHQLEKLKNKRDSLALVLDLLLDEGSDPNCRQESSGPILEVGWSLVHHLARVGDHARLLWFLHRGSQVDPVDAAGTTPLLLAAAKGRVKCVAALLARGADMHHRGPSGQTALHFAACGGGALVARTLVAAGADPAALDDAGNTPVDVARKCSGRATLDVLTLHRERMTPASVLVGYIAEDEIGTSSWVRTPRTGVGLRRPSCVRYQASTKEASQMVDI